MAKQKRKRMPSRSQSILESLGIASIARRRFSLTTVPTVQLWAAFLFALVAILPLAWGVRPLSYYLGYIAKYDVISRVDFEWTDPEEEQREIHNIEQNCARRYVQDSEWIWVPSVSSAIWNLLEEADRIDDPDALLKYAKDKKIELEKAEAGILLSSLRGSKDRIDPFSQIISPMQDVLRKDVFRLGLLSAERYRIERGKRIRIVDRDGRERPPVRVSRNDPLSPIDYAELPRILDNGFVRMPVPVEFRMTLRDILLRRMTPSLHFDKEGSDKGLQNLIARVRIQQNVKKGVTRLLKTGQRVTPSILAKLRKEDEHYQVQQNFSAFAIRVAGKFTLIFILAIGFILFWHETEDRTVPANHVGALVLLGGLLVVLTHVVVYAGAVASPVPVGLFSGAATLLLTKRLARLAVLCVSLILFVLLEGQAGIILSFIAAGWCFVSLTPVIRRRLDFIGIAVFCGVLAATVVSAWGVAVGEQLSLGSDILDAVSGGHLAGRAFSVFVVWSLTGFAMLGVAPLLESTFSITTNIRLHELQDQEHPLLRQLVMEAPGTYHHSIIVGTLAETAAESIGANALLAKVGSYYHDIGKLMKPEYFAENESGMSRHDVLKPSMSALIIIAHVKDGVEMAHELGLPPAIVEMIEQHHGDDAVRYFLHRAREQAEAGDAVEEHGFRYPGPVPQTREAAILMLADSVEAATRSLKEPGPTQIRKLVHDIIFARLTARQLDASGLTLTDLERIETAFCRVLTSMFHSRVQYPGQVKESGRRRR